MAVDLTALASVVGGTVVTASEDNVQLTMNDTLTKLFTALNKKHKTVRVERPYVHGFQDSRLSFSCLAVLSDGATYKGRDILNVELNTMYTEGGCGIFIMAKSQFFTVADATTWTGIRKALDIVLTHVEQNLQVTK
jgi:hypothetical protein